MADGIRAAIVETGLPSRGRYGWLASRRPRPQGRSDVGDGRSLEPAPSRPGSRCDAGRSHEAARHGCRPSCRSARPRCEKLRQAAVRRSPRTWPEMTAGSVGRPVSHRCGPSRPSSPTTIHGPAPRLDDPVVADDGRSRCVAAVRYGTASTIRRTGPGPFLTRRDVARRSSAADPAQVSREHRLGRRSVARCTSPASSPLRGSAAVCRSHRDGRDGSTSADDARVPDRTRDDSTSSFRGSQACRSDAAAGGRGWPAGIAGGRERE